MIRSVPAARFYDDDYLPILRRLCLELIDKFGPITFGDISERVARAHGFQRTGSEIKRVLWRAIGSQRASSRCPQSVTTFWPEGLPPSDHVPYRGNKVGGHPREWDHTPYAERLGLAVEVMTNTDDASSLGEIASRIGLSRLRDKTKQELLALLEVAENLRTHMP
jgi:hypothetical protein